ncbi:hypothetical protein CDAR_603091 [Caerostris darwini]|uniref:Ribosomal protein S14 n=1 Tax=Caerostris darwini TaxID=1538125 RepID=A0AAV4WA76_9ARAC|nr:hypothetical protein CDAR_603091 [Caerostris darwini]
MEPTTQFCGFRERKKKNMIPKSILHGRCPFRRRISGKLISDGLTRSHLAKKKMPLSPRGGRELPRNPGGSCIVDFYDRPIPCSAAVSPRRAFFIVREMVTPAVGTRKG